MADTPIAPKARDASVAPSERRLESWGEIALYLKRDIRTAQRYEKNDGLPVRRMRIGKGDQVYAFPSELDQWIRDRQPKPEDDLKEANNAQDNPPNNKEAEKTDLVVPNTIAADPATNSDPPDLALSPVHWRWVAGVAGAAIILALAVFLFVPNPGLPNNRTNSKTLLFVRPFTSLGMEGDQRVFVEGLRDESIVQLSKLDPARLGVFGPSTSDEDGKLSIQKLRDILHADYVLEGSVRLAGEQLRIDATMISTKDGSQAWANSYTGLRQDVLKLQDEITRGVAKEISATLPPLHEHVVHSLTVTDSQADEAYREGRVYWLDRDLRRSLASYEKSLSKDPKYAPALAGIATAYLLLGETPNDVLPPDVAIPKARKAANEALAIDPKLADALCVLANIAQGYDHNLAESERLYKRAIEVDPSNVTAHEWYGYYLVVMNRMKEADQEIQRALEIEPASPLLNDSAAELKYYERDYDGAIKQAKKTLDEYPGFFLARFWLGSAYREKKMYPLAIEQFHIAREGSNDLPCMVQAEANVLGLSGDQKGATKLLSLLQTTAESKYVPALYFAGIYEGLGDREKVFQWLDKAYEERNDRLPYLGVDPIADPLRGDPRFKNLMQKVGLPVTLQNGNVPTH
jgi:TolB-like protein/tetratricopeptide (TPR) repeat protein